jgi:PPOX class probable F420-dependent enzyme
MQLSGATEKEIAFLEAARVARLATVDPGGRPHAVPVCFAIAGAKIFTPLDEKPKRVPDSDLRRVRNILANPSICLLVDSYSEDWSELAWLQVRAHGSILSPGAAGRDEALLALRTRYPQYRDMALEERPMLALTPERIVSWRVNR